MTYIKIIGGKIVDACARSRHGFIEVSDAVFTDYQNGNYSINENWSLEKINTVEDLIEIKNKQKDLRLEYDATSKLKSSIKDPMRLEINKKRDEVDKEFEELYDKLKEEIGEEELLAKIL